MAAAISFSNVTCKPFFQQFSCSIEQGCTALLVTSREDESSSLLRLLTGLEAPSSGSVHVLDHPLADLAPDQIYQLRRQIGVVPFSGGLVSNLKMWENITLPLLYQSGAIDEEITAVALTRLEQLEYHGEVTVLPAHLTLYEKRITAFVRATLQQPQLMVYCNSLDGIPHNFRANLAKAALEFHQALPGRTSLFMTSSRDIARDMDVDIRLTVHESFASARTA